MKVTPKKVIISTDVSDAVNRIKKAFNQLGDELVGRNTELEAMKLALVTKRNVLFDGLHGTAKSLLASRVFDRVRGDDLVIYRKQLMKGTQPDELFGPMNAKLYREQAIWTHNTSKMLPEAHLAFLDEVYRGSDMLLPSILGILNEREFINGTVQMKCPLITAVGTTNFVTEASELAAFHDRWLYRVKVLPLSNSALRLQLLNMHVAQGPKAPVVSTFTLADLTEVNEAIYNVPFASDAIDLYEETVTVFRKRMKDVYVSDRRLCLTVEAMRAQALFDSPAEPEVTPEHIAAAIHGIAFRNTAEEGEFTSAAEQVIGSYTQFSVETAEMKTLEGFLMRVRKQYASCSNKKEYEALRMETKEIYNGIKNMDSSERPKKAENIARLDCVINDLGEILNNVEEKLTKK